MTNSRAPKIVFFVVGRKNSCCVAFNDMYLWTPTSNCNDRACIRTPIDERVFIEYLHMYRHPFWYFGKGSRCVWCTLRTRLSVARFFSESIPDRLSFCKETRAPFQNSIFNDADISARICRKHFGDTRENFQLFIIRPFSYQITFKTTWPTSKQKYPKRSGHTVCLLTVRISISRWRPLGARSIGDRHYNFPLLFCKSPKIPIFNGTSPKVIGGTR